MKRKLTPAMERVLEIMTDFEKANPGNLEILWQHESFYSTNPATMQALYQKGLVERATNKRFGEKVFYRKAML